MDMSQAEKEIALNYEELRQEDQEFEVSLGYLAGLFQNKLTNKNE